ncbi:MAG TPA: hypothetical protein VEY92_00095 [Pseudoxanthomonas sp.]|nr:hypothetical protein [Pseudoxanthomonas sp.]
MLRRLIALALGVGTIPQAQAVFIGFNEAGLAQLTLIVGQTGSAASEVVFNVNTAAALTAPPASSTSVPGVVTPAPTNGVAIRVRARTSGPAVRTVSLVVNQNAGASVQMFCFGGASVCSGNSPGSFSIPITKISWTVTNPGTLTYGGITYNTWNATNGSFTGAPQTLGTFQYGGGAATNGVEMNAFVTFRYNNDTVYPSGSYTTTLIYSAQML